MSKKKTPIPQPTSNLRRSPRLQQLQNKQRLSSNLRIPQPSSSCCSSKTPKESLAKTQNNFKKNRIKVRFSQFRLRRSPRFSKWVGESPCLAGSSAFTIGEKSDSNLIDKSIVDDSQNVAIDEFQNCIDKSKKVVSSGLRRSPRLSNIRNDNGNATEKSKLLEKEILTCSGNGEVGNSKCENLLERKVRKEKKRSSVVGFKEVLRDRDGEDVDTEEDMEEVVRNRIGRKRTRDEEGGKDGTSGWTQEQEMALQRAYLMMKPTPHFWKKVAKMVPGKSAPDCFDKIHSDTLTPPHPRPRSRAKKTKQSPISYELSASEMLNSSELKTKRRSRCRQKTHRAQKTVRHLLQKHYNMEKDYQTDLFSILELATASSSQTVQENPIPSTPIHGLKEPVFLRKCSGSSSGPKKPLSRLSNFSPVALVSPPVLKQVKNRALHEKYIDQLHNRDAKRRAASSRRPKIPSGNKNKMECHQNLDVVKAAKSALVSDASDVINLFRSQQAIATNISSEFDDDINDNDSDDDEI